MRSPFLNNTQAVIYLKDRQGRYLLINRRYEQLFNLDREEVKGKTDLDIFPQEIAKGFQANDRQVIEDRKPLEWEELVPQADGLHTYFSLKFPHLAIRFDISDRKQAEQKIGEQAALLDLTIDAIIVRDLESEIQFWNQGAARIYGWQAAETIAQNLRSLLFSIQRSLTSNRKCLCYCSRTR